MAGTRVNALANHSLTPSLAKGENYQPARSPFAKALRHASNSGSIASILQIIFNSST